MQTWTKEDNRVLTIMRANNEKLDYIALKLKRSFWSVANKARRVNDTRAYKRWTESEFEEAKRLYASGRSYKEIGQQLGRSRESVQGRFQEYSKTHKRTKEICPVCGHELTSRGNCPNCGYTPC